MDDILSDIFLSNPFFPFMLVCKRWHNIYFKISWKYELNNFRINSRSRYGEMWSSYNNNYIMFQDNILSSNFLKFNHSWIPKKIEVGKKLSLLEDDKRLVILRKNRSKFISLPTCYSFNKVTGSIYLSRGKIVINGNNRYYLETEVAFLTHEGNVIYCADKLGNITVIKKYKTMSNYHIDNIKKMFGPMILAEDKLYFIISDIPRLLYSNISDIGEINNKYVYISNNRIRYLYM